MDADKRGLYEVSIHRQQSTQCSESRRIFNCKFLATLGDGDGALRPSIYRRDRGRVSLLPARDTRVCHGSLDDLFRRLGLSLKKTLPFQFLT